jgi:hypothetical protein
MSTFETDEHLHAEHRYTAGGGVVSVLTFVTRELFVLFDGFTIPPQATEQWVDAGLEKFSKMRVRSRLIPAMSGCDWKTDVLDLARKSWDDACPTVRRSPSVHQSDQTFELYSSGQLLQFVLDCSLPGFAARSPF